MERPEDIAWANSLLGLGRNAGIMVGPMIGGVLLAIARAPHGCSRINAATFLVSILLTISVRGDYAGERTEAEEEAHQGIGAGDPVPLERAA